MHFEKKILEFVISRFKPRIRNGRNNLTKLFVAKNSIFLMKTAGSPFFILGNRCNFSNAMPKINDSSRAFFTAVKNADVALNTFLAKVSKVKITQRRYLMKYLWHRVKQPHHSTN